MARYSNSGFYSKDTIGIQSGYDSPQFDFIIATKDGTFAVKEDKEVSNYFLYIKIGGDSYFIENKSTMTLKDDRVNTD